MGEWYDKGLQFSCTKCHACCRHDPGYVFLSVADLDRLASLKKLTLDQFREQFCRVADFGFETRLSLIEKPNNDCVFWDNGCTVYEARPLQCRSFPFWSSTVHSQESWDEAGKHCPGINQGATHSAEVVIQWISRREREGLLKE